MKKRLLPFAFFLFFTFNLFSQVWSPQAAGALPDNFSVMNVSIVSDQVAWAIALDYGQWGIPVPSTHILKVLRTTNGGTDWSVTEMTQAPGKMTLGIWALNDSTAIFSTLNFQNSSALFRTTDAGNTWTEVLSGPSGAGRVMFFNALEGVSFSIGSGMARTDDGGESWSVLTPNMDYPEFLPGEDHLNTPTNYDIYGDTLWIGTTKGRMYRSVDKGQNWTVHQATDAADNFGSIAFIDSKQGLALVGDYNNLPLKLIKTTNGGESWEEISNNDNLTEVLAIPCSNIIVGTAYFDSLFVSTKNLGTSWGVLDNTLDIFAPSFYSPEIGWAVNVEGTGSEPALYKWDGGILNERTYVNHAATGNNDGTSWADAYTDLQDALAAAEEGDEIWVAEGTYLPGTSGGDPTSTFLINKDLKLYGGFAGSECNLSERDIEIHPTILSGDLNGDDTPGDFQNNRSDNTIHVLTASNADSECLIDGFTVQGGAALQGNPPGGADGSLYRGGGIFFRSSGIIRNCTFQDNSGRWGAGCTTDRGNEVTIEDCHFKNNSSERSALYLVGHADAKVIGTEFSDNHASEWGGAANSGNSNCSFLDCTFTNNTAGSSIGGAVFIWENSGTQYPNPEVVFERCIFTGNQSSNSSGGALTVNNFIPGTKVFVDSCEFQGNAAPNVSALYLNFVNGQNCTAQVTNSTFTENTCTDDYAAVAIWTTSPSSADVLVENCVFENNTSAYSGALDIGGAPDTGPDTFVVRNCKMLNNIATATGGGLTLWSDARSSIAFEIEDCQLIGNSAGETAGAVLLLSSSNNSHAAMRRCEVRNNASPVGGTFGTSQFDLNEAGLPDGSTFLLENSLVTGNTGTGVVMLDMYPGFKMLNTTLADNEATGILLDEQSSVELQNTILANPGYDEYIALTNDVIVTSLGGNLIGDNSLATHALTYDQQNADPLFMGTDDYHLSATSPAIDKGVDLGNVPPTDLDGNDRPNGCVDIGAYESDVIVSMDCITSTDEAAIVELVLSPNPTTDFIQLQLPESITQPTDISLFDAQGRLVDQQSFLSGQMVRVGHLPSGFYTLKLTDGERVYVGKFVKQ